MVPLFLLALQDMTGWEFFYVLLSLLQMTCFFPALRSHQRLNIHTDTLLGPVLYNLNNETGIKRSKMFPVPP